MLRRVLDVSERDLSPAVIEELIKRRVAEFQLLDFKERPPARSSLGKFARNVCAFANADGGLIVYGVDEENDRAKGPPKPFQLAGVASTLTKVLNSKLYPSVHTLRWHTIRLAEDGEKGYLVLEIRPSSLAPHAVWENEGLSFWRRTDTDRYSMPESEVRREYQRRWLREQELADRIESLVEFSVAKEGFGALRLSVAPLDSAGRSVRSLADLRRDLQRSFVDEQTVRMPNGDPLVTGLMVRIRHRRIEIGERLKRTGEYADERWGLLGDGGEFVFHRSARRPSRYGWADADGPGSHKARFQGGVDLGYLVCTTLGALDWYREMCDGLGLSGRLLVRLSLLPRGKLAFVRYMYGSPEQQGILEEDVHAETQTDVDDLQAGSELLRVANDLLVEVANAFDMDRLVGLSPEGLEQPYFHESTWEHIEKWAGENDVPIVTGQS